MEISEKGIFINTEDHHVLVVRSRGGKVQLALSLRDALEFDLTTADLSVFIEVEDLDKARNVLIDAADLLGQVMNVNSAQEDLQE